jgi:glycosyltransferase involved in cell wall biosynthesis
MTQLALSVVIPTFNRAHLVGRAIQSALACTDAGDEILVVDDASTDNTADVVNAFGGRVRFLPGPHGGAGFTRNRGIRAATRPLLAFLDSDDEWLPDKIALQRSFLERRPDVLFCFSDFTSREGEAREPRYLAKWHKDGRGWDDILGPGVWYSNIVPLPVGREDFRVHVGNLFLQEMLSDYVATSTVVARRVEAGDALFFAEDLKVSEDKECFARLAQRGPAAYFDCDLSYQWGHAGCRLTEANLYELTRARITLMERIWGKDAGFMRAHGEEYADKLRQQYRLQAHWLLARGRTAEARAALKHSGPTPWHHRVLAALPGPVMRGLLRLRRAMRLCR